MDLPEIMTSLLRDSDSDITDFIAQKRALRYH